MTGYRLALMFFLLMIGAVTAVAQPSVRPYIGVNSSSLNDGEDDLINFENGTGLQVGVDLQFGTRIYVQPGIQLEFLKNTAEFGTSVGIEDSDFDRTGLRIPLLVGFRVLSKDSDAGLNLRFFTGPNVFLRLGTDYDNDLGIDDSELKDTLWGWNAGAGLDISIFFVDVGYQAGLSEISGEDQAASRNNLFYANAGLRLYF